MVAHGYARCMKFEELRQQYPVFRYESCKTGFTPHGLLATYQFSCNELKFEHNVMMSGVKLATFNQQRVDTLFVHLGLVELLSYWKATCSPQIEATWIHLGTDQKKFWGKLYLNGMGEYFFQNQIDFTQTDFLKLVTGSASNEPPSILPSLADDTREPHILIPIGGGKDSAVTAELLAQHFSITPFILNPTPAEQAVAAAVTTEPAITVSRTFDPKLLGLSSKGYLNGHVPFSATLAFLSVIAGELGGFTHVAISNEHSSNEGNVLYLNTTINHQYSKTIEFESDLNAYLIPLSTVHYFSFVRPLYELQIAKLFSAMPHFFSMFRSCNRGQKTNSWCGNCPKCLSIALTMLPWVGVDTILSIFGSNPLANLENISLVHELAGRANHKPFECVLTTEETLVSLYLCIQVSGEKELPAVLTDAQVTILNTEKNLAERAQAILDHWEHNPNMPVLFEEILKQAYQEVL